MDQDLVVRVQDGDQRAFEALALADHPEHDLLPDGWLVRPHAVAPDGSFWVGWSVRSGRCPGVNRFDGRTWVRFLPGRCVDDIDIAADGSVWLLADNDLYVITPEAVAATE